MLPSAYDKWDGEDIVPRIAYNWDNAGKGCRQRAFSFKK